jgi:hypothetical protein
MLDWLLFTQIFWVIILAVYAITVIFLTKIFYDHLIKKRVKKSVAVYYNRKLIHIFAGGVIALMVPFVFKSLWYPLLAGLLITLFTLATHLSNHEFYWFQNKDDLNDVTFCFMWGIAIAFLWFVFDNPWIAIIPPAFIAFGDGITGIVRNIAFKQRKKHIIGNIYMMGVCIPIGYFFAYQVGIAHWGIIAAVVASLFERYEFGPIDDNILITVSSTGILLIGKYFGPLYL